jgi:uncharacterized protein (DUF488 family)
MTLFTIGHSNHPLGYFLALLHRHDIETLCDVRTTPYSRHHPQFNHRMLRAALENEGIGYLYLGQSLGGKPKEPGYAADPRVRFAVIAATPEFRAGMARLLEETRVHRTAILCAERDPAVCHRSLLVCAHLPADVSVRHILADGSLRTPDELAVAKRRGDQQRLPL